VRLTWDGGAKVARIPGDATFLQLKEIAQEATSIAAASQRLLSGFPQKAMELGDGDGIAGVLKNGDTVVVNATGGAAMEAGPKAAPANAQSGSPKPKGKASTATKQKPKPKPQAKGKKRAKNMGQGRSLNDSGPAMFTNEESIIEKIANAASGGPTDGEDTGVSYLRDALKIALVHTQQETLANLRYRASLSGNYEFETMQSFRLGDGESTKVKVKFKGDNRTWEEDEVDALSPEMLKAVYEHVLEQGGEGATEHLKPFKMALISPRCFWSLIQHFGDAETGLRTLFPDRGARNIADE